MTAATATSPFDVLRTRFQSDYYQQQLAASRASRGIPPPSSLSFTRASALHIRETFQVLFAIPRVEGRLALFKGLGPNLIGVVPARSINFYCYGNGKKLISNTFNDGKEAAWVHLTAGAAAGIITGTATNPIWLVKTRLQLDKDQAEGAGKGRRYRGAWDCVVKTVRQEGVRGLYRGLTASYLGVTESTAQWVLYEKGKEYLARREESILVSKRPRTVWDDIVSSTGTPAAAGGAKLFAAILTYPHEVVRTRLRQAPMQDGRMKYTGLWQCFATIFKEEGIAALYGGLVPHMMRVVPSAMIMFGTYEGALRLLGENSSNS